MVSYEQGWLDSDGTLALKNNTDRNINNVSFRITYLDMSGNALDYEEYSLRVDTAPGMTRKIDTQLTNIDAITIIINRKTCLEVLLLSK